jgi:serine phosphatase RsbU (regulator of sigma subunit)
MTGEEVSGDGFAVRPLGEHRVQVMVCDGLGHGPLAAVAAQAAEAAFWPMPDVGPREVVEHVHRALGHTRGAVIMVAELDAAAHRVRFAGLGNITGAVVDGTQKRMMASQPGIAGHQRPSVREIELPYPASSLLVMHTDGLTDRWNIHDYPGLSGRAPLVIAATLLRDASVRRDDATVLVAKANP